MKSSLFQWFRRKENSKEFTKNVRKLAKTVGTVGSMKNYNDLALQELSQW
jgi:hypothetical protein